MRRLFFFLFLVTVFLPENSFGQNQELILWARKSSITPWYFYTGEKFTAEARYNLDEEKTMTVCLGKSFGKDSFSVNPEFCGYGGKSKGYGPEIWVLSETEGHSVVSYVQYAKLQNISSFGYAWFQTEKKVSKHFGLGAGTQVLKEERSATAVDLGPSVKVKVGKFSFNVLPMWRATSEDRKMLTVSSGVFYEF
jgi:hypothetical protein